MARDVIMPALGMGQESGVLIRWLVPEGGSVSEGDPLMEVETNKAVVEVPANASGTMANVAYGEGAEVAVGTVLAVLLAPGESPASVAPLSSSTATAEVEAPAAIGASVAPVGVGAAPDQAPSPAVSGAGAPVHAVVVGSRAVVLASPKAKRLARERGLDLTQVVGSGPAGAVRSTDLPAPGVGSRPAVAGVVNGSPDAPALGPGAPLGAPQGAAWMRATVDASGLNEFVERVGRSSTASAGATIAIADVLTRVVAAGLAHDPAIGQLGFVIGLSVHDAQGGADHVSLRDRQLASMLSVAAARRQAVTETAGTYRAPGLEPGGRLRVEIVDRSADPLERSGTPLSGGAPLRLTLGPVVETISVRAGEPSVRWTTTLQLDYDAAILDEPRAAALITYVSRLVGDPFAFAVQG